MADQEKENYGMKSIIAYDEDFKSMNDAAIPVAYAMNVSSKRYALFLGAGLSISAGLPTGIEVAAQLIRNYAAGKDHTIEGGHDPDNCFAWYNDTFDQSPTFDLLMKNLGITDQNRVDALKPIILPNDERGNPRKPTLAHLKIAQLVKEGMVSVIITTNFDPLLEDAINNAVGHPVIITSESDPALMSIIPDKCRIIKVNGDFTSKGLKITPADLSSYDPIMTDYLRRIFSEYGLIICGWSAEYDTGMIQILESVPLQRYPIFWCLRPDKEIPRSLVNSLKPIPIEITTADSFFTDVQTIITRIRIIERRQPLTIPLAVKKVTDALQQPRPEIVLSDLIHQETDLIIDLLSQEGYVPNGKVHLPDLFRERIELLERTSAPLATMLATLAYYDDENYCELLFDVVERLINVRPVEPFRVGARQFNGGAYSVNHVEACLKSLRLLPALLVVYSAGITATKAEHFNMLGSILAPKIGQEYLGSGDIPYYDWVNPHQILTGCDLWVGLNRTRFGDSGKYYTIVFEVVHEITNHLIPSRLRYSQMYDIFEYLYALAFLNSNLRTITIADVGQRNIPALESRLCWTTFHTAPPGKLIFPASFESYFANFEKKAANTRFFDGDIRKFEVHNIQFAALFGINQVETGINLSSTGRVL